MKKIIKSFLHTYLSILTAFLIISISVLIILNFKPIYYSSISSLNIRNAYSLSSEEIKENYNALIEYNMSFEKKELVIPHLPSSEEGLIHFKEVRAIFQFFQISILLHIVIFLLLIALFKKWLFEKYYLLGGGVLSIVLTTFLSIFSFFDFNSLFVLFHEIAFRNDFWIFDYRKDPIILYLPESFFLYCALGIFFLIFLGSILSLFLYFFFKKRSHTPH